MLLYQGRGCSKALAWEPSCRLQWDLEHGLSSSGKRRTSVTSWEPSPWSNYAFERLRASEYSWCKRLLPGVRVCDTWADEVDVVCWVWCKNLKKKKFKKRSCIFSILSWWICIISSFAALYRCPQFHPHPDPARLSTAAASLLAPPKIFFPLWFPWYFWEEEKKDFLIASAEGWATASMCGVIYY